MVLRVKKKRKRKNIPQMRRKIFNFPSSFTLSGNLSTHFRFSFYFLHFFLFCFIWFCFIRITLNTVCVKDIPIEVTLKFPTLVTLQLRTRNTQTWLFLEKYVMLTILYGITRPSYSGEAAMTLEESFMF